jgi:hypothetical protein
MSFGSASIQKILIFLPGKSILQQKVDHQKIKIPQQKHNVEKPYISVVSFSFGAGL